MKGLFENKNLIYLDQFATSGMFDTDYPAWNEIKNQLIKGVNNEIIVCPLSIEHYLESSQKDKLKAIELDKEYSKLSNGFAFKPELFITSQLLISNIRKNKITRNTYLYKNVRNGIFSEKKSFQEFQKNKKLFNIKIEEATSTANKIRELTRDIKVDSKTIETLIKTCKAINVNRFIDRLNDLIKNKKIVFQGGHFKSGDIPHWVDLIIHRLTNKHRMKLKETNALVAHLKKNGFEKIPTLDIRTTLSAIIAAYNKNESANDQIDIMRISTGLPISDILLTDKKRKNEIIISGLDKKYLTKVYSGTPEDLELLIDELKKINN